LKIRCPNCSHKFSPSEDELYLDYEIDYDSDDMFVWERLPIRKSSFTFDNMIEEDY